MADFEHYFQRGVDESRAHKLKSAYWTTKQAMIKKFGRKQDENIVASDSDLDAKLELLKSIQSTCRELGRVLTRYQETVCYLSQAENEMGRFLKRYSMEDRTQAGKIMAAAGKSLSHSSQQRLLLRNPLDRVIQEVKTFRQRAISDTIGTLKRMEAARTEYRGALLWMKNVSEELDPDMYKQLEKFRCVQAQVRKTKSNFDRLKIDSMQKIDLLSASRCNMLSHALVGYQNSMLTFLEKTSGAMVAVAERFKGYQYYEFSVLKELRPESKKWAGVETDGAEEDAVNSVDEGFSDQSNESGVGYPHTPPGDSDDRHSAGYGPLATNDLLELSPSLIADSGGVAYSRTSNENTISNSNDHRPTEEELDQRLDEIFKADNLDDTKSDELDLFQPGTSRPYNQELISRTIGGVPEEHKDFLTDLFSAEDTSQQDFFGPGSAGKLQSTTEMQPNSGAQFASEWNSVFSGHTETPDAQPDVFEDDPWSEFQRSASSTLPSHLLDRRGSDVPVLPQSQDIPRAGPSSSLKPSEQPIGIHNPPKQQPTSIDTWMSLFSDLGTLGNPDLISKKEGQISDA